MVALTELLRQLEGSSLLRAVYDTTGLQRTETVG